MTLTMMPITLDHVIALLRVVDPARVLVAHVDVHEVLLGIEPHADAAEGAPRIVAYRARGYAHHADVHRAPLKVARMGRTVRARSQHDAAIDVTGLGRFHRNIIGQIEKICQSRPISR